MAWFVPAALPQSLTASNDTLTLALAHPHSHTHSHTLTLSRPCTLTLALALAHALAHALTHALAALDVRSLAITMTCKISSTLLHDTQDRIGRVTAPRPSAPATGSCGRRAASAASRAGRAHHRCCPSQRHCFLLRCRRTGAPAPRYSALSASTSARAPSIRSPLPHAEASGLRPSAHCRS